MKPCRVVKNVPNGLFGCGIQCMACCCVCAEEPQSLCDIGLSIGSNWLFGSIGEALS